MSKKIATFKDLDTLASLDTGTSAGYISGAENEQCVTKGNFDTVSTKTIAAKGNGLMFVDGSESSKYESNRLILLDDVQYISEITAVLVSAPNIPAKGGSSYATWKLSQSYKVNGDTSPSVIEWQVTGSVVEASSKGTTISDVTNVANSTATATKNGKSISLSQMIKQDLNKITSYGNWTSPTVTVNPTSFAAAGGTATITISGDSTRENTWSSGSKTIDTAYKSNKSASFATISSDYKTLTVGVNTTGSNRTGKVYIDWSFESDNNVVKSVVSNEYSQVGQSDCTLTLTGSTKAYHETASIIGKASVAGTIYWGTSQTSMTESKSLSANTNTTITSRTSLGTTTIYAYFVPTDKNYKTLGSSSAYHTSASAKITHASDASITITTSNKTYNGSAQTVVTCDSTHGVSTWALGYATSDSATSNSGVTWIADKTNLSLTNAGTYYIWRRWTADGNHSNANSGTKIDATVTISKKAATVTAGSTSKTYDGSALTYKNATLSGQVSGHTLGSYTCTGSITNVGYANNVPSAAKILSGSTDVTANYNITYKNGTLTVSNASFTVSASDQTYTYTGSAQGAAITVSGLKGSQTATIKYGTTSGTYNLTTAPTLTTVGSTTVYYQVTASNHTTKTGSYKLTITNATFTVSAPNQTFTYSGSAQGNAITVSGLKGSQTATIKYGTTSGTYNTTTAPKITNANEDTTIYWQVTAPNHATQTGSYTITMNQKDGSGSVTMSGWVYDGIVSNPLPSSSTNGTSNVTYTWYDSSKTALSAKPTSTSTAGTYYVKATFAATTNYKAYTTDYVSFTIAKANGSITFSPANQSIQCKNSSTQMTAAGVVTCTSATNATGTVSYTLNTGSTTLSNCSLSGTKLTVPKDTAKGTYTISITAKSAATTNYKEATKTSTFTLSVLGDTAGDIVGTLTINDSSTLSAGADSRTITWGNIYSTWTHGGGKNYPSGNATLSITCSNSSYKTYVTLDKTSYANSSSTTTTTLTKATCGSTTFSSDVTFVISLKFGSTTIKEISIKGSKNVSTITPLSVMYYGAPTLTFVSGTLTPGNSSVQVSCTANNLMAVRLDYTSGYYTNTSATVAASTSWALTGQSCVGNATRFSVSGNTLTHTTMGKTLGTDVAILQVKNLTNNSTTAVSKVVTNSMAHTLTSMSMTYTVASYSSGSKNTPTVRYNTTYRYTSGAAGGSTTGNTGSITGATFTKTFKKNSGSTDGSLNTSTGVVTWNYANTTNMSKVMNITCTGQLVSQGTTTSGTAMANAYQAVSNLLIVTFVNKGQCPSTAQLQVNSTAGSVGTINSSTAIGGSFYITSSSTSIVFTLVLSGVSSSTRAVIQYQNAKDTSSNISSTTMYASSYSGGSTYPYTGTKTFTVQRPNTSNAGMCNINVTIYN